jgi:hypothetical protein
VSGRHGGDGWVGEMGKVGEGKIKMRRMLRNVKKKGWDFF